jgi:CRP/FNR family transcriptional regulator
MHEMNVRKTLVMKHHDIATHADAVHDNATCDLDSIHKRNRCKLKHFTSQEIIYREGDQIDNIHIIRNGIVKLVRYLPNGRARIIRLHNRNQWLGSEGLIGSPYEHTAIAVGDVETNYIPVNSLKNLESSDPGLYREFLKHVYQHLIQADKWIADFSTGGIKPRVARLLLYLSDLEYGESSDMIDLLTVHELADVLGVTQESVSRILADLKRRNTLQKTTDKNDETYKMNQQHLQYEAGR